MMRILQLIAFGLSRLFRTHVLDDIARVRKPQFKKFGIRHATINDIRLHLRWTDPTEQNFLWINGTSGPPLILDQTDADMIAFLIDGMWLYQRGDADRTLRRTDTRALQRG